MAETAEATALCNGSVPSDGDDDQKMETVEEKKEEKTEETKEEKKLINPGKALMEFLEKNKSPLSAVFLKKKDFLLEILESENYKKVKEIREKACKESKEKKALEVSKDKEVGQTEEGIDKSEVESSRSSAANSDRGESEEDEEQTETEKNRKEVPFAAEMMALNQGMMIAITTCQPEMLEILLQAGADPDSFDKWYPVIHTIVDMRKKEIFDVVKKYISNIEVESYYGNLLHASARAGSLELVKEVYEAGVTKMAGCKANGSTPLHDAVRCVPPLEEDKEDDGEKNSKEDKKGIQEAGSKGPEQKPDVCENASGAGGNEENSSKVNKSNDDGTAEAGTTPKKHNSPKFDFRIVEFLLDKGCEVNGKDDKSKTPLHEAAIIGNIDLVNILLKAGAKKMALDSYSNTPWIYAAIYGHSHLFDVLLEGNDIDEAFNSSDNRRYLHKVAELGKIEALRFLLGKGANQLVSDNSGFTPLYLALQQNRVACAKELLNHPDLCIKGANKVLPFICALGNFDKYEKDILELMLAKGQEIDCLTSSDRTPLLQNMEREKVLTWLLQHGANPDYINPDGDYALMKACENDDDEIVRVLLKHNADVTKTDMANNTGFTPLQAVIHSRNYQLSKLCLIAGFSLCKIHDWLRMEEEQINAIVSNDSDFEYFFEYIKMNEYAPVSLKGLCRLKALKCLGCVDVEQRIKQLGLPVILEDYLNWEKYLEMREGEYTRCIERLKSKKNSSA